MNDEQSRELIQVLQEINTSQKRQIENQDEILGLQRENLELVKRQFQRADKLQERAESIQNASAGMIKSARKALAFILPVIIVLIVYLSWIIFR